MIKRFISLSSIFVLSQSCVGPSTSDVKTTAVDESVSEKTSEAKDTTQADKITMTITPNKFKDTEQKIVAYTVTNKSSEELNFGTVYHIERNEKGVWSKVPFVDNYAFNEPLIRALPSKAFQDSIYISASIGKEHSKKGHYRILKDVNFVSNRDSTITLIAKFDVE